MNRFSVNKVPSDVMREIAERHQQLRKSKNWSRQELATKSDVSASSIKRFETTGLISLVSLLKLAHVFGRLTDFNAVFEQREDLSKIDQLFNDKTK